MKGAIGLLAAVLIGCATPPAPNPLLSFEAELLQRGTQCVDRPAGALFESGREVTSGRAIEGHVTRDGCSWRFVFACVIPTGVDAGNYEVRLILDGRPLERSEFESMGWAFGEAGIAACPPQTPIPLR